MVCGSSRLPMSVRELAKSFGETYCDGDWTTDYAQLIQRDDIDAVIVTSYTSAHADHVELAAAAGKHVLLDKPIATNLADAKRIVEAGKTVKVMLAYLLRYLPAYRQVFAAVEEGAVGDLVSGFYSIRFPAGFIKDNPDADDQGWYRDPIKGGGGGFIDHGVHFTDFFRWFFKSEAATVTAHIGSLTYKDLGVEDYGIATYTLENGAIVTVESTWHAPDYFGPLSSPDHASLSRHARARSSCTIRRARRPRSKASTSPGSAGGTSTSSARIATSAATATSSSRSPRRSVTTASPSPNAVDGYKALEWILGAYESHRTGQRVAFPLANAARPQLLATHCERRRQNRPGRGRPNRASACGGLPRSDPWSYRIVHRPDQVGGPQPRCRLRVRDCARISTRSFPTRTSTPSSSRLRTICTLIRQSPRYVPESTSSARSRSRLSLADADRVVREAAGI